MADYLPEHGQYRDNPRTAARYLAGLGYTEAQIVEALTARVGVTGWTRQSIQGAARAEVRAATELRGALRGSPIEPIPEDVAGRNVGLPARYRYGVMFVFEDGESRLITVLSDKLLSQIEAVVEAENFWPVVEAGSPRGRLAGYDPKNASVAEIITFERR
jgi:hypothetical protein